MQGTITSLIQFKNDKFKAYRAIKLEKFSGLAAFALALLEHFCKFKGTKKGKDLVVKIENNLQAVNALVQDSEQSDFNSAKMIIYNLHNADYVTALKWVEAYAVIIPEAISALIIWMQVTLRTKGIDCTDNGGIWDYLQILADEFEVCIEKDVKYEDIEEFHTINLLFDENSDIWYILYKASFLNFVPRPELCEETNYSILKSNKIIENLVSVLKNKGLSTSSLSKLEQYYKKTQDKRVECLINSNTSSSQLVLDEESMSLTPAAICKSILNDSTAVSGNLIKCFICKKPLPVLQSFNYFCKNHPQCPSCFDFSKLYSTCSQCTNCVLPENLSLIHLLSITK